MEGLGIAEEVSWGVLSRVCEVGIGVFCPSLSQGMLGMTGKLGGFLPFFVFLDIFGVFLLSLSQLHSQLRP